MVEFAHPEQQYLDALRQLVEKADRDPTPKADRTGTGTYNLFGAQWRFPLSGGQLPMLTTKKLWFKAIVAELLWMLSGDTNNHTLTKQGVHIWDEWADEDGELGPIYGAQWRDWRHGEALPLGTEWQSTDQMKELIHNLKTNPNSRRHVISAWNVGDLPKMNLAPCHCLFQFFVEDGKLSCQLYQRSADIFLGVPFNIASYALLTHLIAREVGLKPGEFIHTFGDLHLYANHVEAVREQLTRGTRPFPTVEINDLDDKAVVPSLFDVQLGDIVLNGYDAHPNIKAKVAV